MYIQTCFRAPKAAMFASFSKATRRPSCGRATAIANVMIPVGKDALLENEQGKLLQIP